MYRRTPKEIRSSKIWRLRPQVSISCPSVIGSKVLGWEGWGGLGAKANGAGERERAVGGSRLNKMG